MNKILFWLGSVILTAILLVLGSLYMFTDSPSSLMKFLFTYQAVKENYFHEVTDDVLFEGASNGMVSALDDPHSMILSGDKYESFMQSTSGEYGGIGVVIGADRKNVTRIISVFPGSSAEKNGLQSGDIIKRVNDEDVSALSLSEVSDRVRGEAGTRVSLLVERENEEKLFWVERSNVSMPTVQSRLIDKNIGYIHIFSFAKHTDEEFEKQLASVKAQGADRLIIDLRMNPGGLVDTVISIMNQILTKGRVLSYHTRNGDDRTFDITGIETPLPMVILIDRNSASASEILAGAVQDKKEGIIIGETSYGKGTVQSVIQNGNKSALKISIAEYRTAAGRIIDKTGITPDIAIKKTGHVFKQEDDNVLKKAIEVLSQ
ncbi:S41 family peptidase [Dialister invisus]|uniref:S41 family peptidase n=1 Tax=Dialister invisus TaxID=218538 RepID=UPI0023F0A44C|nr:S41 family peptidase [Dialister invisus]